MMRRGPAKPVVCDGPRPPKRPKKGTPPRPLSGILVLSDLHIEEVVRERAADGSWLATHGPEESRVKLRQVLEGAIAVARRASSNGYTLDHLTIGLLGDLITGHLHEDNVETTALAPTQAAVLAFELIADFIAEYVRHAPVRTLRIVGVAGNHGRTTPKMRVSTAPSHSWEILIYEMLRKHLHQVRTWAGNPLEWVIQTGVQTYTREPLGLVRWIHGHEIRYNGGVLGPLVPIAKAVDRWNREPGGAAALTCLGHFHQAELVLGPPAILVNGSLIGVSAYGRALGFGNGAPTQVHLIWSDTFRRMFALDLLGADAVPSGLDEDEPGTREAGTAPRRTRTRVRA